MERGKFSDSLCLQRYCHCVFREWIEAEICYHFTPLFEELNSCLEHPRDMLFTALLDGSGSFRPKLLFYLPCSFSVFFVQAEMQLFQCLIKRIQADCLRKIGELLSTFEKLTNLNGLCNAA